MRKTYYLATSMADRFNFDSMAYECGRFAAQAIHDREVLTREDPGELARQAEVDFELIDPEGFDEEGRYTFPGGGQIAVDDLEEAQARWKYAWAQGFEASREEKENE